MGSSETELPEDAPIIPETITRLKQPLAGLTMVEGGLSYLYGDKFVSTQGVTVRGSHFLSESFGIGGGLSFYKSSASDEVATLSAQGITPLTHDPSFLLRATAIYQPVYGKIAIGSFIQRFRLGIEAGLHAAQESYVARQPEETARNGSLVTGPLVGARALWLVSERFSVLTRGEWMIHSDIASEKGPARKLWELSLGVGYTL